MLKKFKDLTEREILAIAIANEEEDGRIYGEFADALRESYPATGQMFEEMRNEEAGHRDRRPVRAAQTFESSPWTSAAVLRKPPAWAP